MQQHPINQHFKRMDRFEMDQVFECDCENVPQPELDRVCLKPPPGLESIGVRRAVHAGVIDGCRLTQRVEVENESSDIQRDVLNLSQNLVYIVPPPGFDGECSPRPIRVSDLELFPGWRRLEPLAGHSLLSNPGIDETEQRQELAGNNDWQPYDLAVVNVPDPRLRYYSGRELDVDYDSENTERASVHSPTPLPCPELADHMLTEELAEAMVLDTSSERALLSHLDAIECYICYVERFLHRALDYVLRYTVGGIESWLFDNQATAGAPKERSSTDTSTVSDNLPKQRLFYQDLIEKHPTDDLVHDLFERLDAGIGDHWVMEHISRHEYLALTWLSWTGVVELAEEVTEDYYIWDLDWDRHWNPNWYWEPPAHYLENYYSGFQSNMARRRQLNLVEMHLGSRCVESMRLCWSNKTC